MARVAPSFSPAEYRKRFKEHQALITIVIITIIVMMIVIVISDSNSKLRRRSSKCRGGVHTASHAVFVKLLPPVVLLESIRAFPEP